MAAHELYVVAVADLQSDRGMRVGALADVVCSCGRTFRVRDNGSVRAGVTLKQLRCLDHNDASNAIHAIQRSDIRPTHPNQILGLGARDIDGEILLPGSFVESVEHRTVGYVDRYNGPNIMRIETVVVLVPRSSGIDIQAGSGRYWRQLEGHDSRIPAVFDMLRALGAPTSQALQKPEIAPFAVTHWWASWLQRPLPALQMLTASEPGHPRQVPPNPAILAYWTKKPYRDAEVDEVTALCRGSSVTEVRRTLREAWGPGMCPESFIVPYPLTAGPPGEAFPAPRWSLETKRWPWSS